MDKVVHFELPADDVARAKKFYETAFGWQTQDVPEFKYTMLRSVETDPKTQMPVEAGAINGGMYQRDSEMPHPLIYMGVVDIEASLEKIKAAGGEVLRGKMPVGDMGFIANFKDSEGNILGLWQQAHA